MFSLNPERLEQLEVHRALCRSSTHSENRQRSGRRTTPRSSSLASARPVGPGSSRSDGPAPALAPARPEEWPSAGTRSPRCRGPPACAPSDESRNGSPSVLRCRDRRPAFETSSSRATQGFGLPAARPLALASDMPAVTAGRAGGPGGGRRSDAIATTSNSSESVGRRSAGLAAREPHSSCTRCYSNNYKHQRSAAARCREVENPPLTLVVRVVAIASERRPPRPPRGLLPIPRHHDQRLGHPQSSQGRGRPVGTARASTSGRPRLPHEQ